MTSQEKLVDWIFRTNAVKVCEEGKPFWYTSGTIGPFFVNTHFLYGNDKKAEELLAFMEENLHNKNAITSLLFERLMVNYEKDDIYKNLIDILVERIKNDSMLDNIDFVSGGERRDWFFSIIVAYFLKKPHLTIFKDKSIYLNEQLVKGKEELVGKKVLHIADLITEASSYQRAWIPAIEVFDARIVATYVVVDRVQGGKELLDSHNIIMKALLNIDNSLFEKAYELGLINNKQLEMVVQYQKNPRESMMKFLIENPNFIKESLEKDPKTKQRVMTCIKENIYQIDFEV